MPMNTPVADGERRQLLAFVAQQRQAVRTACHGLDEQEARATPTGSALSVGGLLKHATWAERGWIDRLSGPLAGESDPGEEQLRAYLATFHLGDGETVAAVVEDSHRVEARCEEAFAAEADLERLVPLAEAPWLPAGAGVTVRWILLHLVEELARHAGHADIIRESLDGATSGPLMAAVEGWPRDGWIAPWERSG